MINLFHHKQFKTTSKDKGVKMTLQQLKYVITIADCGSMNEAAKQLFIAQPSLSGTVKELEKELGITLFIRSNRGITITPDGSEFLVHARQVLDQYSVLEDRYISKLIKKKFSVSTQHYTFAVKAFVELVQEIGMDDYEFALHETKTADVISHVKDFKSELGIIYINQINEHFIKKILREYEIDFLELLSCETYVYLYKDHPLADQASISMEQLKSYPCIAFEQGSKYSFHFSEEMKSTYDYSKLIKVDDRATALNLMVGLNAYTLCSGIICEELNGYGHIAIPLQESEPMTIGIIHRQEIAFTPLAQLYISKINEYFKSQGLL